MTGLKTPTWTWKVTLKGNYSINISNDIQKQTCLELSPLVKLYFNVIHKVLICIFSLFYPWWYWKKLGPFPMAGQDSTHHLSMYSHLSFIISDWTKLKFSHYLDSLLCILDESSLFECIINFSIIDSSIYEVVSYAQFLKEHFSNLIFFSWQFNKN